ncbi:transposase [Acidocella sp.]|uniref:transposase n=1 Tax=Acidocella sp. TaxID=50710 RepID=UPI00345754AB
MFAAKRVDNRKVQSGILHALKSGCRWHHCPPDYGPPTTIYNRFARWPERGGWERLFQELARRGCSTGMQLIDSTHTKARRSAPTRNGQRSQATGRSQDGRNTKNHAIAGAKGRLLSLTLMGG